MNDETYVFRLTAYNIEHLLPQVSAALEKRNELASRFHHAKRNDPEHMRRLRTMGLILALPGVAVTAYSLLAFMERIPYFALGVTLVICGLVCLWNSRYKKKNPYDKAAAKLLSGKDQFLAEDDIRVIFNELGMKSVHSFIPYTEFACTVETNELFFLSYGPLVTMVKKSDLIEGDLDGFRKLVKRMIPQYARA